MTTHNLKLGWCWRQRSPSCHRALVREQGHRSGEPEVRAATYICINQIQSHLGQPERDGGQQPERMSPGAMTTCVRANR